MVQACRFLWITFQAYVKIMGRGWLQTISECKQRLLRPFLSWSRFKAQIYVVNISAAHNQNALLNLAHELKSLPISALK